MASTIQGYEGSGRSLSLKLLNQLRQQSSSNTQVDCKIFFLKLFNIFSVLKFKFF